jgi:RES domain
VRAELAVTRTSTVARTGGNAKERICSATGLTLIRAREQVGWRVAKTKYGPLSPLERPDVPPHQRTDWGRWDVVGHRTVYLADTQTASYAEALAPLRVAMSEAPSSLDKAASDYVHAQRSDSTLDLITANWAAQHHSHCGFVPKVWRDMRALYPVTLPESGWFVRLETANSVAAVHDQLGLRLSSLSVAELDLSVLNGPCRAVTTAIAEWVWKHVLDDGSRPHGIRFPSRLGADLGCWAVWLRNVDDGRPRDLEPTKAGAAKTISATDSALKEIADRYHLRIY